MINVLITGVTGFVGKSLVSYLHKNAQFRLFGHARNYEKARQELAGFNIEIISAVPEAETLDQYRIDTVIHLAGIAHDLSNQYKEEDYDRVNFQESVNLYDNFLKSSAKKFIYFSSIKAAVDKAGTPVYEEVNPAPVTPYGKSKRKAEQYIQQHVIPGKSYYLLRPCMIHGAGNKGNLNLLYRFVKAGIPYPLGAFENRRSFLSAENMSFIVEKLITLDIPSGIYHLADSGSLSTNEVVRIIAAGLDKKPRVWSLPAGSVKALFTLAGKKSMLSKLTENMEVANDKIIAAIQSPLPVSVKQGLINTIQSFRS